MSDSREEIHPNEVDTYEGQYRDAIIDALNVLGCWHSPLHGLKEGSEEWYALLGEDYEWREARSILYGALGIDLDEGPEKAYTKFRKVWEEATY